MNVFNKDKQYFNGSIKSLSELGKLTINFDAKVKTTYLPTLNSSNTNISIEINNGFEWDSEFNNQIRNFTWEMIKFENETLEIQVDFSKPLLMSYG